MEAKDRRLRRWLGRARTFSYFIFGFFGLNLPSDQRSFADRIIQGASHAHAALRVDGGDGIYSGVHSVVFHRPQRRRSFFSQQSGETRRRSPPLDREKWIWRNAGGCAVASAYTF